MQYLKKYYQQESLIKLLFIIIIFLFSKEWIVINEEFIVAISFIVLFVLIYKFSSSMIMMELQNRGNEILNLLRSLYKLKLFNQKKLLNLYQRKIKLFKNLRRINGKAEDVIYYISLHRNLITKETITRHTKGLIIYFLIKRNFKLRKIHEKYLNNIKSKLN